MLIVKTNLHSKYERLQGSGIKTITYHTCPKSTSSHTLSTIVSASVAKQSSTSSQPVESLHVGCNSSIFCYTLLYVISSFAIIFKGERELVALLSLSSWFLVMIVWLFLLVPWVHLRFVIVVYPDHTHLLFFMTASWERCPTLTHLGIVPAYNSLKNYSNCIKTRCMF